MQFFDIVDGEIKIAPEVLINPVLQEVVTYFGTKGLLAVFYLCWPEVEKNPYWSLTEDERYDRIQNDFRIDINDPSIINAASLISNWIRHKSPAYYDLFLHRRNVEKALKHYANANFDEETKTGHLKYKVLEVSKAQKELTLQIKAIELAQKLTEEQVKKVVVTGRAGREIGQFENPNYIPARKPLKTEGETFASFEEEE